MEDWIINLIFSIIGALIGVLLTLLVTHIINLQRTKNVISAVMNELEENQIILREDIELIRKNISLLIGSNLHIAPTTYIKNKALSLALSDNYTRSVLKKKCLLEELQDIDTLTHIMNGYLQHREFLKYVLMIKDTVKEEQLKNMYTYEKDILLSNLMSLNEKIGNIQKKLKYINRFTSSQD